MLATVGMYDFALKPKLLLSRLREDVPNEKHPFRDPSVLTNVVSDIKTHKLLSEWAPEAVEQDLVDTWKSAVDSWVNRVLTLASSNSPDKCWAGICLLGLTAQECSSERFLASYTVWLNKLLSHVQPPAVSHFVKAAACAAISDLFTRLSGFSNAKKDATSQATRVIQPALKLLNEDSSADVLEEAICLLCTMINFFPLPVQRHYDSVEAAIVSKLMSGTCSATVLKKLGYGLSLLPKARGDEDSWSLMMDKILLYVNNQFNDAFQGLEEEESGIQTMRALFPSGKEAPPPLSGLAESGKTSDLSNKRPECLLGSRVSTLLECCCHMLTNAYPVTVPVPVSGLVALAGRVLRVDGSLSLSSYSFMTTLKPEFICSEIPRLQLRCLEILTTLVISLKSQLLPHAGNIVQLLKECSRICKLPELKIKAYSIWKALLNSMGVGIAVHIGSDIVSIAFNDLHFLSNKKDGKISHTKVHSESLSESRQKKRKHSSIAKSSQEQPAHDGLEAEVPHTSTPISVKIAALEVLETLLNVGGSMKTESWRANVDDLLITIATNACQGGFSKEENSIFRSGDHTPSWADFQEAALKALLASLCSPSLGRHPHLSVGLELFRRGMQDPGTKLAEHCLDALIALEAVIHPRSLPLDSHSGSDEYKFLNHIQVPTYQAGTYDEPESEEDDLNENWLGNDDEMEIEVDERKQEANYPEKSLSDTLVPEKSEMVRDTAVDDHVSVESETLGGKIAFSSSDTMVPQKSELVRNTAVDDHVSVEPETLGGKIALLGKGISANRSSEISEASEKIASTSKTETDEYDAILERISATLSRTDRGKGNVFDPDRELSPDSLPDIVDGDPDSD